MISLDFSSAQKAFSNIDALRMHKTDLQNHLSNIPKDDPFYYELERLLELCSLCDKLKVTMNAPDIELIQEVNALSDQLSSKLNHLNSVH